MATSTTSLNPGGGLLNFSLGGNPSTVKPLGITTANTTMGSATPASLTQAQTQPFAGGLISPSLFNTAMGAANPNAAAINKAHSATLAALSGGGGTSVPPPNPAVAGKTQGDPLLAGIMSAPVQSATVNPNAAPGTTGSADPTASTQQQPAPVPPGTLGTGSATQIAGTQTPTGLLGNMLGQSQALYQQEQALNNPFIQKNMDIIAQATAAENALAGGSFVGDTGAGLGRQAQFENIKQAAQQNINQAQQNLSTFSGQAQTAFGTGLTAATQQVNAPYGTPLYNPLTGTYTTPGGGVGGGGLDPASQGAQLAQQVTSGTMDFNTALSQMSSYGAAGAPALRNAILKINPNFNFNLSQSSAATQATGQQIAAAVTPANQALDALQTAYDNLPDLAKGTIPGAGVNVPWLQGLLQSASLATGAARPQVSAFQGALNEARARVDGALQGIIGVDAARAQALALLPDNMQPNELPQKIAAAKQYLQNQLKSYVSSGQQQTGTNTNQNASSLYSW